MLYAMIYTNSDYIIDQLAENQTKFVFTIPGRLIDPLFDSCVNSGQIQPIIANHEMGAGFMADGYARAAQHRGVCLSIGAPGVSNLLTAAITARLDGSSVLFIAGSIPVDQEGLGAFQDGGIQGTRDEQLFQQAVYCTAKVTQPQLLDKYLSQTLTATAPDLRRPAYLSIPLDIQTSASQKEEIAESYSLIPIVPKQPEIDWTHLCQFFNQNQKIILLVGQLTATEEAKWLRTLAETFCLPVATVDSAKGIISEHHQLCLGTIGFGGNWRASAALTRDDVDAIVLIGVNLSEQDCLGWNPQKYVEKRLFSINKKPGRRFTLSSERQLQVANYSQFLQELVELGSKHLAGLRHSKPLRQQWLQSLQAVSWDGNLSSTDCDSAIPLEQLLHSLNQQLPDDTLICVDAGEIRRVAGYAWRCQTPCSFFSAYSTAPMGWAIAAGVGVQLAQPEKTVLVVTGDGSMRMHGLEIATAARYQLPIIYVVCNNQAYGTVYTRYSPQSSSAQQTTLPPVNWVQFAQALGVTATKVSTLFALNLAIEQALASRQTFLIEAITPISQL
jgi:acetolactate synthase I/II/III large subunit